VAAGLPRAAPDVAEGAKKKLRRDIQDANRDLRRGGS